MAKTYKNTSKKIVRKKKYIFTPFAPIYKREIRDEKGNTFTFIIDGRPHKPSEPTIRQTITYED